MVRVTWRSFCVTFREQLHLVSRASGETRRCRKAVKRATAAPRGDDRRHGPLRPPPHDVQACSAEEAGGRKVLGSTLTEDGEGSRCGGGRDHSPGALLEVVEAAQISSERIIEHIACQVPQERDHERMAAQRVDIPALPIMKEIATVSHQERIAAQRVDVLVLLGRLPQPEDCRGDKSSDFERKQLRRSQWSLLNECNNGPTNKL